MQPQETSPTPVVELIQPAQTTLEIHTKKMPKQRHFLILFFFSFMWGSFGVDRFYMGFIATGILKLITFGGFGIWALIDFILVMTGNFKDKQGRVTLQADEYRKFARRTTLWFAIILGLFILINGIILIYTVFQLITDFQTGGASSIPGFNQIQNATGGDQSQINSLLKQ